MSSTIAALEHARRRGWLDAAAKQADHVTPSFTFTPTPTPTPRQSPALIVPAAASPDVIYDYYQTHDDGYDSDASRGSRSPSPSPVREVQLLWDVTASSAHGASAPTVQFDTDTDIDMDIECGRTWPSLEDIAAWDVYCPLVSPSKPATPPLTAGPVDEDNEDNEDNEDDEDNEDNEDDDGAYEAWWLNTMQQVVPSECPWWARMEQQAVRTDEQCTTFPAMADHDAALYEEWWLHTARQCMAPMPSDKFLSYPSLDAREYDIDDDDVYPLLPCYNVESSAEPRPSLGEDAVLTGVVHDVARGIAEELVEELPKGALDYIAEDIAQQVADQVMDMVVTAVAQQMAQEETSASDEGARALTAPQVTDQVMEAAQPVVAQDSAACNPTLPEVLVEVAEAVPTLAAASSSSESCAAPEPEAQTTHPSSTSDASTNAGGQVASSTAWSLVPSILRWW